MNSEQSKEEIDHMANILIEEFGTEEHGWDKKPMICVDVREMAAFVNNYRRDAVGWEESWHELNRKYINTDKAYESNKELAEVSIEKLNRIRVTPERLYPYSIVSNGKAIALYDPCVEGDAFYQEFDDMESIVAWLEEHRTLPYR